ncbi:hypothetical protein INT45_011131 [Circinella minor]|uniref:Uncharacterized protein n=1 Tax=Circinella minor TaxID=1195481 RepID=A0A8H7VV71_9FUNG|nr:hypothetical protein INT45_011131 [Circinella minor]
MLDNLWSKILSSRTIVATIAPPSKHRRQRQQRQQQQQSTQQLNKYYHRHTTTTTTANNHNHHNKTHSKKTIVSWQEQERILWVTRIKLHCRSSDDLRNTVHLRNMLKKLRQELKQDQEDDEVPLAMLRYNNQR